MKYYLDTEFDGFGGELISLALVREDGESIYIVYKTNEVLSPWVKENVIPILWDIPSPLPGMAYGPVSHFEATQIISKFLLYSAETPTIITDWPDDIKYFCQEIITGPGEMINLMNGIKFEVVRVDAYPSSLVGAVQHNAWWDAKALKYVMQGR